MVQRSNIALTAKHLTILRAFSDSRGHYSPPRLNVRVNVWNERLGIVVFDLDHITNMFSRVRAVEDQSEWRDLVRWNLVEPTHLGHPIYQLTPEANIYLGN